jgi:hypothetical protein
VDNINDEIPVRDEETRENEIRVNDNNPPFNCIVPSLPRNPQPNLNSTQSSSSLNLMQIFLPFTFDPTPDHLQTIISLPSLDSH